MRSAHRSRFRRSSARIITKAACSSTAACSIRCRSRRRCAISPTRRSPSTSTRRPSRCDDERVTPRPAIAAPPGRHRRRCCPDGASRRRSTCSAPATASASPSSSESMMEKRERNAAVSRARRVRAVRALARHGAGNDHAPEARGRAAGSADHDSAQCVRVLRVSSRGRVDCARAQAHARGAGAVAFAGAARVGAPALICCCFSGVRRCRDTRLTSVCFVRHPWPAVTFLLVQEKVTNEYMSSDPRRSRAVHAAFPFAVRRGSEVTKSCPHPSPLAQAGEGNSLRYRSPALCFTEIRGHGWPHLDEPEASSFGLA